MNNQMIRKSLMYFGVFCFAIAGTTSTAKADGACGFVLPKGVSSGRWRCIDKVASEDACNRACEREAGISAKFYPGKTCADLEKANASSTNVSMRTSIGEAVAMVQKTGSARLAISFTGVDRFTDRTLAGTEVSLTGTGTVLLTRGQDGKSILINADHVNIKLTSYRAGEVNPLVAKQMELNFRSARVLENVMRGQLVRVANGYQINLEQERHIAAQGISGWISSSGTGFIPLNATSFVYKGTGVTMHSLLMTSGE